MDPTDQKHAERFAVLKEYVHQDHFMLQYYDQTPHVPLTVMESTSDGKVKCKWVGTDTTCVMEKSKLWFPHSDKEHIKGAVMAIGDVVLLRLDSFRTRTPGLVIDVSWNHNHMVDYRFRFQDETRGTVSAKQNEWPNGISPMESS